VRVVLDTNILISACWKSDSLEAQVTALVEQGRLEAFVTREVLAEYRDVLQRDKFRSRQACLSALLQRLEAQAVLVLAGPAVTAALDPDDNHLLECAAAAHADYLVTGNKKDLPALWLNTRVVNARELLESLNSHS
jgi:uncharacterized protein